MIVDVNFMAIVIFLFLSKPSLAINVLQFPEENNFSNKFTKKSRTQPTVTDEQPCVSTMLGAIEIFTFLMLFTDVS